MKKNKLFIFISMITIVFVFGVAATCNFCETPLDIGIGDTENIEEDHSSSQKEPIETAQTSQDTGVQSEGNNPPVIRKMEFGRLDVEVIESEGNFDSVIPGFMVSDLFTIEAYDEDGDEITYKAYDSLGTNFEVTKIDNNNAEFRWRPTLTHLGSYTLTIEVSDGNGGTDSHSIDMTFVEAPAVEPEPEPEPEPEVHEIPIAANPDISGYLWSDEYIVLDSTYAFIGDSDEDFYSKGYFSFDIRELHGKTVQDAEINFISIVSVGNPRSLASEIVVKVYNYIRLDASDFAVGGVQLPSIPISAASYTIGGNTLKNELQDVLDNSVRDYFQLKLGLNGTNNDNGVRDGVDISFREVLLNISYTD